MANIFLILLMLFVILISGLFSGSETGIYQLSKLRLRIGVGKKQPLFILLAKTMRDIPALLISILIGNNLTHYIVTSIVTFFLLKSVQSERTVELFATLLTSPILFIYAELIPKNIFFYRSNILMPYVCPFLFLFKTIFTLCGIVPLIKFISHFFAKITGTISPSMTTTLAISASHISILVKDTAEEGFFSSTQNDIIARASNVSDITIAETMIYIKKTQMVDVNSDRKTLISKLKNYAFTRFPVYENRVNNIVGFVNIYECLNCEEDFTDLQKFLRPIRKIYTTTTVTQAIDIMRTENQKIVLVVKFNRFGKEKSAGIATMKDLIEELFGELSEW